MRGLGRRRLGTVAVVVAVLLAAAIGQEDDSNDPDNAEAPTFVNTEATPSGTLHAPEEAELDAAPNAMELLRSTPSHKEGGQGSETEMNKGITPDEEESLRTAEKLSGRAASEEAGSAQDVAAPAREEKLVANGNDVASSQETVVEKASTPAAAKTAEKGTDIHAEETMVVDKDGTPAATSKTPLAEQEAWHPALQSEQLSEEPCLGVKCAVDSMHDSAQLQQSVAAAHYHGASLSSDLGEGEQGKAATGTGSGSGSAAKKSSGGGGECCPCTAKKAAGSGSGAGSGTKRRLLSTVQEAAGSGSGSAAGGKSGKCCPCEAKKEIAITLNMDKPANAAEMKKFQDAFKIELTKGIKLEVGRVSFPTNKSMAELQTEEQQDTDLGEDLDARMEKFEVKFQVAPGGAKNTTQVVDTIKKDLSNPTTTLAKGKIMSTLDKPSGMTVKSVQPKSACDASAKKWGYKDPPSLIGPANWKKKYPKCGMAGVQSPVRLPLVTPKKAKTVFRRLDFDYKAEKLTLMSDGRNLMATVPPGSSFRVSGKPGSKCQLQYVIFHSPSEHVFTDANGNDIRYAAEMQLHHRASDGRLVVVSVLFKVNAPSPFIEKMFKKIPKRCQSAKIADELKFEDILPFSRTYYMYYGTLTNPPCTDSVTWYVLRNQATMSLQQLEKLRKTLGLDILKPPAGTTKKAAGTKLGDHTIKVIDKDKYPEYEYSKTLMGNVRPVQPFGTRKLWTTPAKL
jgi:carbonic anhydrase